MKSNYDVLGNHIRLTDVRNKEQITDRVLGISIDKFFMPSVANVIGTDLSKYKLLSKGEFACNPMHVGRDERLPVALYVEEEPAIVSPAYFMFEVIDNNILDEEYLMMWFRRPEFDRECWFHTDSSVRGGITWDDICQLEIPIPPIEKQQEIIKEYKTVTDRIDLKMKINENLVDTIKTTFKAWFLDFSAVRTPKMITSQYGDIPSGWKYVTLGDICDVTKGTTPTTLGMNFVDEGINFIKGESINDNHSFNKSLFAHISKETDSLLKRSKIIENDIVFTIAGTLGKFALVDSSILPANTNQAVDIIRADKGKIDPMLLYTYFIGDWQVEFYKKNVQKAVQANLSLGTIKNLPILLADEASEKRYAEIVIPLFRCIQQNFTDIECLTDLQNQILCQLSSR